MSKSLVARARLLYLPFDISFGLTIPLAIVNSLDAAEFTYSLMVFYVLGIARTTTTMIGFGRVLGPIDRWFASAPSRPEPREIQEVADMIQRAPFRLANWNSAAWVAEVVIGVVILMFWNPYRAAIPPRVLLSPVLVCAALVLGGIPLIVPMMSVLVNDASRRVFALSHAAGMQLRRDPKSLKNKLLYLMATIGLAGPMWVASISTQVDADRATLDSRLRATLAASDLASQLGTDPPDTAKLNDLVRKVSTDGLVASISTRDGVVVAGERKLSPPLVDWMAAKAAKPPVPGMGTDSQPSPRAAEVAARAVAPNGLIVVVVSPIGEWTSTRLVIMLLIFFVALLTWTPVCSFYLSVDVVRPIQDITKALQQITEVGKLDEVAMVAVTENDETGQLSTKFNDLVDTLRGLSVAAGALAKGDLEIRIAGDGDVATAFRAMIESLGRIVRQIHETSVLLAAAATEIYAASQEQEAAAASQSTAMAEIRQTMESLFEAAAHVAESVRGVLSNAERTLETTDRMVVRIGDLTNHAGRIGEILETIRDISDRSDLLALNGALEASRAGEAGRGFGLVAAEMRRLAERVMSSVHDVRSLVGDIRASGSSTMMATEDSKKLAASTTDAARQITMVTQQQRSGTEQVLQSVREIAETLAQSVAAMAQSRASAEQLKSQADKLSGLVRAFRIETTST
jgi:methyl-accepting chemotaxis protein